MKKAWNDIKSFITVATFILFAYCVILRLEIPQELQGMTPKEIREKLIKNIYNINFLDITLYLEKAKIQIKSNITKKY